MAVVILNLALAIEDLDLVPIAVTGPDLVLIAVMGLDLVPTAVTNPDLVPSALKSLNLALIAVANTDLAPTAASLGPALTPASSRRGPLQGVP